VRRLTIEEPTSSAWRRWKASGEKKRAKHVADAAAGGRVSVSDHYKGQKDVYRNREGLFNGRCVYCEQLITSNQHGDIEHFRPKAAVQDENWTPIARHVAGIRETHPGYFWLAYDWQNLLLSCISCNQVSVDRQWGKGNRFPVAGLHPWKHDDECDEQPLLLNPVEDEPTDHFKLDGKTGILTPRTDRGRVTIDVLGLNKRDLPAHRAQAYDDAIGKFNLQIGMKLVDDDDAKLVEKLKGLMDVTLRDFASAWHQGIRDSASDALRKAQTVAQGIEP
jgi:hypothetical protein